MRPLDKGVFRDGTLSYQLWSWLDGEDLEDALPRMSHAEQFETGKKCGAVARKIHFLPPLYDAEPWGIRYKRKVQKKIHSYNNNPFKSRGEDLLMRYLQDNQGLLDNRPQTFTHGDWNTENIMISPDGQIRIIDRGDDCNDPWWEFWEIRDDADSYAHFYTGQIKGYFEGEPPAEYFPLLAYYMIFGRLSWGYDYKSLLNWFNDMQNPVPTWYLSQI
jgi:serine/threonine-protein kinase